MNNIYIQINIYDSHYNIKTYIFRSIYLYVYLYLASFYVITILIFSKITYIFALNII